MKQGEVYQFGEEHFVITDTEFHAPAGLKVFGRTVEDVSRDLSKTSDYPGKTPEEIAEILRSRSKGGSPYPIIQV